MSIPPVLTLEEAADLLRVTPRWLKRSLCPRIRIGRIVRYDREVILAWFRQMDDTARAA